MVGVEEEGEFRFCGDLYSQESTFPLVCACERLFSSSDYIVNKTRAALLPERVASLVCLRDWLKA